MPGKLTEDKRNVEQQRRFGEGMGRDVWWDLHARRSYPKTLFSYQKAKNYLGKQVKVETEWVLGVRERCGLEPQLKEVP